MGETSTTINYTYDPLYRLTAADYSNGDNYHYAYDAVGNRLQQGTSVNRLQSTVNYQYDIANRLASMDNVNYTWDANGNLLNYGTSTYTYDPANRMSSEMSKLTKSYRFICVSEWSITCPYKYDPNEWYKITLSDGQVVKVPPSLGPHHYQYVLTQFQKLSQ